MFKYQTRNHTNTDTPKLRMKLSHVEIGIDGFNASSDQTKLATDDEHNGVNKKNSCRNETAQKTVNVAKASVCHRNYSFLRSPTFLDWKPPDLSQRNLHIKDGSTFADFNDKGMNQLLPLRYSIDNKLFPNVHCSWQSRSADLVASYSPRSTSSISSHLDTFASPSVLAKNPKLNTLRPTLDSVLTSRPINVKDLLNYSYNTSSSH